MMYGWGAKISRCQCNTIFAKGAEAKVGNQFQGIKHFQGTRFSNSGFCHLGVNFFVFCRNLKTKTDLKSLCNFQIECGISKDLMIKFLPKIKKMLFFSVFDLIFLRVFSFLSVKNMIFLV